MMCISYVFSFYFQCINLVFLCDVIKQRYAHFSFAVYNLMTKFLIIFEEYLAHLIILYFSNIFLPLHLDKVLYFILNLCLSRFMVCLKGKGKIDFNFAVFLARNTDIFSCIKFYFKFCVAGINDYVSVLLFCYDCRIGHKIPQISFILYSIDNFNVYYCLFQNFRI